ncbi:SMI1/KNR4 family protein [Angustibacter aerolatus]
MTITGPVDADGFRAHLAAVAPGWVGREPASEAALLAAEQRLGVRLPPSYRAFLAFSNGGDHEDSDPEQVTALYSLFPVEQVQWWRDNGLEETIDGWEHYDDDEPELRLAMRASLLIADGDDGGLWYLDPTKIEDGEWRAWTWWPGSGEEPTSESSFGAKVVAEVW